MCDAIVDPFERAALGAYFHRLARDDTLGPAHVRVFRPHSYRLTKLCACACMYIGPISVG